MRRMGSCLGLKAETIAEYKRIHAYIWPGVLARITDRNIRNYAIFLKEHENLLFVHFEYHGTDFEADSAKMAADPATREWWKICGPMQVPFETRKKGEWWASTQQEVFHTV